MSINENKTHNGSLRERIGSVLLALALVALAAGVGVLLVERTLTLVNEVAFGVAGVLLLAFVIVEPTRTRTWITGKQVRYGSNALAMTVVLLAILSVGNFLADRHPHRIDVTANRSLSLAPQSVDVLESLQGPVHVIVFYTSPQDRDQAADLLDQYSFHSPDMEVEFHDLEVEISAAMQWGVDEAWRPTLFILYQDRREEINVIGEREITSALVRLSREGQPVAYFLTGHGEPDLDSSGDQGLSALREQLAEEGFQAAPLNLLITSTIPSDASVVVALGPQRTMAQEEVERLAAFVDGGGAAMILLDPPFSDEEGSSALDTWLADQWSVAFRDDVVVDPAASHPRCAYPVCPVAEPSGGSVIGRGMANTGVYFIEARSITQITTTQETTDTVAASPHYLSLVQSSADSWGETSWEELAYDDEEDVAGPVDIAVTLENTESGAKLALFGDASFCTNLFVQDLWNGDLFINTLDWLTEEEELISIRPQPDVNRSVMIPSVAVYNALLVVLVVAVPLLVLGIGGVVLLVRRSRQ